MKNVYLIMAVVGAVVPYWFFGQFVASEGIDLGGFVAGLFANGASGGFSADLLLSSFAFWLAMYQQKQKGKGPGLLPFVALNLLIGLSCALPAYLYARETQLG
jgi:hypothetical protein